MAAVLNRFSIPETESIYRQAPVSHVKFQTTFAEFGREWALNDDVNHDVMRRWKFHFELFATHAERFCNAGPSYTGHTDEKRQS